jgi:hypothetical protein
MLSSATCSYDHVSSIRPKSLTSDAHLANARGDSRKYCPTSGEPPAGAQMWGSQVTSRDWGAWNRGWEANRAGGQLRRLPGRTSCTALCYRNEYLIHECPSRCVHTELNSCGAESSSPRVRCSSHSGRFQADCVPNRRRGLRSRGVP